MKPSDYSELVPTPAQFAEGDTTSGRDLEWRIMACLRSRIPDLKGIRVTVFGNSAVLRGEVRSMHEKRLCVKCCRHVPGVMRVVDDLTVADQMPIYLDHDEDLT